MLKKIIITLFILLQTCAVKAETPYEWNSKSQIYEKDYKTVVEAITDYDNYLKILPYVDNMKVLSKRGYESICYFEQYEMGTTFWTQLKFKLVKNTPDYFILNTIYMKGNAHPFGSQIIVEKISDLQTRVTSKLIVQSPGPSFVPDAIIKHYINNFLKKSLQNLQKHLKNEL